jgi:hypothetical protein
MDEEGAMKLKPLNLGRPSLRQALVPLAAIVLGSGGSLVWANASAVGTGSAAPNIVHTPSEADQTVTALLKQRLPRTQVSRVNCQLVDGVCEVTAGSQLFYVDRTARYLLIGRVTTCDPSGSDRRPLLGQPRPPRRRRGGQQAGSAGSRETPPRRQHAAGGVPRICRSPHCPSGRH